MNMHFFKKYSSDIIIVALFLLLYLVNYVPGTYLAGWDNLQTELNPGLGVKRNFFSAWQEYQSFGLAAGMGHAADLLRTVVLWFASFVIPDHLIRYSFHMSMVLIGGLGMLRFLRLTNPSDTHTHLPLLGSMFYIFNFAVIQMLFLPYEAFSVFFGALPWMLWSFVNLILVPSGKKVWLQFAIINILAAPAFVAQQLFVVYALLLGLATLGILIQKKSVLIIKRGILAGVVILLLNSFWLMPQLYFLASGGSAIVTEAKINQVATTDVLFNNKDKGNLKDFLAYNGFFYDSVGMNQDLLFGSWKAHREQLAAQISIYLLTAIVFIGMLRKSAFRLPMILLYLLVAIALLSNTPPFDFINELVRKNSFINQVFRSPFTKFSIPYALVSSYFFMQGIALLLEITRSRLSKLYTHSVLIIAALIILFNSLPAFKGNYISPTMKVRIPNEYLSTIEFFKSVDPNKRIALLPDYTFWGWFHHDWGYNGSGFLWYGIEQPIISRTFDVWSKTSEGYFWEIKRAVEAEDIAAIEDVLKKYDVDYLILDTSLRPIISSNKALQYETIDDLLQKSQKIHLAKKSGSLSIYSVQHQKDISNFVWKANSLPNIGPSVPITNNDAAYSKYGDYVTDGAHTFDTYFPFLDLTTQTRTSKEWNIDKNANWNISQNLPISLDSYTFIDRGELDINLYVDEQTLSVTVPYTVRAHGTTLVAEFPQVLIRSFLPRDARVSSCLGTSGGIMTIPYQNTLKITTAKGQDACATFEDLSLDQRYGYLVETTTQHHTGKPFFFFIVDKTKEQPYVEEWIENDTAYYIIGNRSEHGSGYSFTFKNESYPTIPASNTIKGLSIYAMPYNELRQFELAKKSDRTIQATYTTNTNTTKHAYYLYTTKPDAARVVLSQAFHPGWKAYLLTDTWFLPKFIAPFAGTQVKHVTVNNWANGWDLSEADPQPNHQLVILYWPQYLQYLGLAILICTLAVVVIRDLERRRT